MEKQQFKFKATILGQSKELVVNAPVRNGFVITNEFCPEGLTDVQNNNVNFPFEITGTIQGESIAEFQSDCASLIEAMNACNATERLDVHLWALQCLVESHLRRCGRLIYTDMLLYVDCFTLLLKADGFDENMIRKSYPAVVYNIVEVYGQYIKDQYTLQPFKTSPLYKTLVDICVKTNNI